MQPDVNYGLWVIMMYHCRVINWNQSPTPAGEVDSRRCGTYVETGNIWEQSILSAQFCPELRVTLKK